MSDSEYKGPELTPLPHPELFNLEVETPAQEPPKAKTSTSSPPEASRSAQEQPTTTAPSKPSASGRPAWQRILYAGATFILYALLIDTAVEAVLDASPIQWWVVGIVGGFLAISALLWRPTGWSMKAGLSTLVFLGLLAGAIWQAGEVNQGLMIVRQPPLVVLPVVTSFLVAWAGIWMMTLRSVPWWSKLIVGLTTLYGISAFVLSLFAVIGLEGLVAKVDFLERLPFWLEGKFVGVLVVLPLALLALLFTGITQTRGRQLWGWSCKVIAFSLGLFMAFQTFSDALPTLVAPRSQSETPGVETLETEQPEVPTPAPEVPEAELPTVVPESLPLEQEPSTPEASEPPAPTIPQDSTLAALFS